MSLLALTLVWLGAAAAAPQPAPGSYAAQVERYRRGDREGALRELAAWDQARLRREVARVRSAAERGRAGTFPIEAALMLHTEGALLARQRSQLALFEAGLEQARGYAEMLERQPERADFVRRWRLALGYQLMGWRDPRVRRLLEEGGRRFPRDPALHLALGQVAEAQAGFAEPPQDPRLARLAARDRQAALAAAEAHYRRALEGDPDLEEAHLRLGRVLAQAGRADEAASELAWVLGRARAASLLYLAHLFQGRLHQDAGRLEEAARSYGQAVALDRRSQAAHLALGHVLDALGQGAAASEAWRAAAAGGGGRVDGWWLYPFGDSHHGGALIDLLRAEVQR